MSHVIDADGLGFHDTVLVSAIHTGSSLAIKVEYYVDDDTNTGASAFGRLSWSVVTISGIERVFLNAAPLQHFVIKGDYGSIFDLEWVSNDLRLSVSWRVNTGGMDLFEDYVFRGSKLAVAVEACADAHGLNGSEGR